MNDVVMNKTAPSSTILNLHEAMSRLNGAANEVEYQISRSRQLESSIHCYPSEVIGSPVDPISDHLTPVTLVQKIERTTRTLEQAIGELQRHNKFLDEHLSTEGK